MKRTAVYCIAEIVSTDPLHYRYFKVGVAGDPYARLSTLQIGNPHCLSLLLVHWYHSQQDAYAVERSAHRYLDDQSIKGEWFILGDVCPFEALAVAERDLPYQGGSDIYVDYAAPHYHPVLVLFANPEGRLQ